MKKIMASMLLAGLFGSATAQAEVNLGDLSGAEMTAIGAAAALTVGAVVNANRSDSGKDVVDQGPQCEGDDPYNADLGACVGTTNTVTVTDSISGSITITVPVTFTYAPAQ